MSEQVVRAVLISAIASGQGKTTVTAALARRLRREGMRVRVFKTGPDFIDPMLLERACGTPVHNLDLWLVGAEECRAMLAQAAAQADVILIEGVMGLYDGSPSSADLARTFGIPVLAVLDASAMAQTAGAMVQGLRDYGPIELAGVIANRVSSTGHAHLIAQSLRDVPLLATLPPQLEQLPERHLGLVLPDEIDGLDAQLDLLADQLTLDMELWNALPPVQLPAAQEARPPEPLLHGKTIAIARDAAFTFLYPANLDCLRALGARLVFFSPLADEPVPKGADAVFLPGGYPELHAQCLAQSPAWCRSIREAHTARLPIVAECGGLMTLAQTLVDRDGVEWGMAGLLQGTVRMQPRLAAIGPQVWHTAQGQLRGHAFHYSHFETNCMPFAHTVQHLAGDAGEAIYRLEGLTASYFHAYFPSCPAAVAGLFLGA